MLSESEFTPPDHKSVALMICDYGKRNGLTPRQLLELFHVGVVARHALKSHIQAAGITDNTENAIPVVM